MYHHKTCTGLRSRARVVIWLREISRAMMKSCRAAELHSPPHLAASKMTSHSHHPRRFSRQLRLSFVRHPASRTTAQSSRANRRPDFHGPNETWKLRRRPNSSHQLMTRLSSTCPVRWRARQLTFAVISTSSVLAASCCKRRSKLRPRKAISSPSRYASRSSGPVSRISLVRAKYFTELSGSLSALSY